MEIVNILIHYFNFKSLPENVIDFVLELSKGNPLFSIELIRCMKSKQIISIRPGSSSISATPNNSSNKGECILRKTDGSELDTCNTSLQSLERIILSRMDDLPPELQVVLKVMYTYIYIYICSK